LYEHESIGEKGYMNQQMNSIGTTGNFANTRDLFRLWSALGNENLRKERCRCKPPRLICILPHREISLAHLMAMACAY
jgi:hypothetical protein